VNRPPGSTTRDGYGWEHQRARAELLADDPPCHYCGRPATHADHVPPLDLTALGLGLSRVDAGALYTVDGTGPYRLLPACARCNLRAGANYAMLKRALGETRRTAAEHEHRNLGSSRQW